MRSDKHTQFITRTNIDDILYWKLAVNGQSIVESTDANVSYGDNDFCIGDGGGSGSDRRLIQEFDIPILNYGTFANPTITNTNVTTIKAKVPPQMHHRDSSNHSSKLEKPQSQLSNYSGQLKDIRFYDKELTTKQAEAVYNGGILGNESIYIPAFKVNEPITVYTQNKPIYIRPISKNFNQHNANITFTEPWNDETGEIIVADDGNWSDGYEYFTLKPNTQYTIQGEIYREDANTDSDNGVLLITSGTKYIEEKWSDI